MNSYKCYISENRWVNLLTGTVALTPLWWAWQSWVILMRQVYLWIGFYDCQWLVYIKQHVMRRCLKSSTTGRRADSSHAVERDHCVRRHWNMQYVTQWMFERREECTKVKLCGCVYITIYNIITVNQSYVCLQAVSWSFTHQDMYKAHHWALYHMWFQNKSDLYNVIINNNAYHDIAPWDTLKGDKGRMLTTHTYPHETLRKIERLSAITRPTVHFACVAWCLIWWFASIAKEYGHTWLRMVSLTRCHQTMQGSSSVTKVFIKRKGICLKSKFP